MFLKGTVLKIPATLIDTWQTDENFFQEDHNVISVGTFTQ